MSDEIVDSEKKKSFRSISRRLERKEPLFRSDGEEEALARLKPVAGMVLSHSCDVDRKAHVTFGLVQPLVKVPPGERSVIRNRERGKSLAYFFLPQQEGFLEADAVVNLDVQFTLSREALGRRETFHSRREGRDVPALVPFREAIESRVLSLNEEGLRLIYGAMFQRTTRSRDMVFEWNPSEGVFEDDPDRPKENPVRGWWWPRPEWLRGASSAS